MAWVNWSRKLPVETNQGSSALGIEFTASRARAATGKSSRNRPLLLDDPHPDLPLSISLEKRSLEVGRPAILLVRKLPHLTCGSYLPFLGQRREWKGGRHCLDASIALSLIFDKLRVSCTSFENIVAGLPSYLTPSQVSKFCTLAAKSRFPLKGTASSSLALVADRVAALLTPELMEAEKREEGIVPLHRPGKLHLPADAILVDVDEHALTASLIRIEPNQVRLISTTTLPRLNVKFWKDRLLDSLSHRCVHICRRDPRDSADAEQGLYDQIDDNLDRIRFGQMVTLTVRGDHWYQDLHVQPEEWERYCTNLIRQSVEGIRELMIAGSAVEPPRAVWMTHEAGRLPGLAQALHQNMAERTSVGVLRPESVAIALANLGERWLAGELPYTHLDSAIPIVTTIPESKTQTPTVKTHR